MASQEAGLQQGKFISGEWLHVDLGILLSAKLNWKTISAIAVQTYLWVSFVAS